MARRDDGQAEARLAGNVLFTLEQLERMADADEAGVVTLLGVKFKMDADGGTGVLGILMGVRDGVEVVSFVGGYSLVACLMALYKKVQAKKVKWRVSTPWGE